MISTGEGGGREEGGGSWRPTRGSVKVVLTSLVSVR